MDETVTPDVEVEIVDKMLAMLFMDALSSRRQDENVARQGVMNHQSSMHLMDLAFIRDSTEMSIPESIAVQGMSYAHLPRESQAINLAHGTPKTT